MNTKIIKQEIKARIDLLASKVEDIRTTPVEYYDGMEITTAYSVVIHTSHSKQISKSEKRKLIKIMKTILEFMDWASVLLLMYKPNVFIRTEKFEISYKFYKSSINRNLFTSILTVTAINYNVFYLEFAIDTDNHKIVRIKPKILLRFIADILDINEQNVEELYRKVVESIL